MIDSGNDLAIILAKAEPCIIEGVTNFNDRGELHAPDRWAAKCKDMYWVDVQTNTNDEVAMSLANVNRVALGMSIETFKTLHIYAFWEQYAKNYYTLAMDYHRNQVVDGENWMTKSLDENGA